MLKTILLMRHAKSSWDNPFLKDIQRPLNKRGNKDAPKIANWLQIQNIFPDQVFCSPAVRTRETLNHCHQILNLSDDRITFEEPMYFSGNQAYIDIIKSAHQSSSTILLIGHNPMTESVLHLLSQQPANKPVKTATIASLSPTHSKWAGITPSSCKLNWIQNPKQLDDSYR